MELNTLFCLRGYDNAARFLAIQIALLFSALIFIGLFLSLPMASSYVALVLAWLALPLSWMTAKRRGAEAKTSGLLVMLPPLALALFIALIPYLNAVGFWLGFVLVVATSAALAIKPAKANTKAVSLYGYRGPLGHLLSAKSYHGSRVEPSLVGGEAPASEPEPTEEVDAEPAIPATQLYLQGIKAFAGQCVGKLRIAAGAVTLVLVVLPWVSTIDWSGMMSQPDVVEKAEKPVEPVVEKPRAEAILEMPDQYWLWLDDGLLSVRWQGDEAPVGELWNYATAKGDADCAELVFNDDSAFRPFRVDVEADSYYLAQFSPLDTETIIRQIARRGSFELCGYDFSLKGSTKALKSHSHFEWFLTR